MRKALSNHRHRTTKLWRRILMMQPPNAQIEAFPRSTRIDKKAVLTATHFEGWTVPSPNPPAQPPYSIYTAYCPYFRECFPEIKGRDTETACSSRKRRNEGGDNQIPPRLILFFLSESRTSFMYVLLRHSHIEKTRKEDKKNNCYFRAFVSILWVRKSMWECARFVCS